MRKVSSTSVNVVRHVPRHGRVTDTGKISRAFRRVGPMLTSLIVVVLAMNVSPIMTSVSSATGGVTFDQCANGNGSGPTCSWINGDLQHSNSTYFEGDSTPQRIALTG